MEFYFLTRLGYILVSFRSLCGPKYIGIKTDFGKIGHFLSGLIPGATAELRFVGGAGLQIVQTISKYA